jgi:hypothetical protein
VNDDPDFDDPAFDDLRALLSDARVTAPIPDDVAARLDTTLASLGAERAGRPVVVPLRRRLAPVLAAAAAVAVVVAGVGIARLVTDDGQRTTAADSAGSEALVSTPSAAAPSARAPQSATKAGGAASFASVRAFTTAGFAAQVADLQVAALDAATASTGTDTPSGPGDPATASPDDLTEAAQGRVPAAVAAACTGPARPGTRSVPILLDGRPAALVLHPVTDGEQLVEAWSCDGAERLASASVAR